VFDAGDIASTLQKLADVGVSPSTQVPRPLRQLSAAMLISPEGTPILLMPDREL
jgi:hypothetical protein